MVAMEKKPNNTKILKEFDPFSRIKSAFSGLTGAKDKHGRFGGGQGAAGEPPPVTYSTTRKREPEKGADPVPGAPDAPPTENGAEEKAIPILKGNGGVSLQNFVDKMGGSDPEIKGAVRSTILKHVANQLKQQGVKITEEEQIAQVYQMIAEEFVRFLDEAGVAIYNHPKGKEHSLNGALQQLRSGGTTGIEKEKLGKLLSAIARWARSHKLKVTEEIENNIVRMLDERAESDREITEYNRWKVLSGIK